MSSPLRDLLGLDVTGTVALEALGALRESTRVHRPGRYAILVAPEASYLVLRAELCDRFARDGLHGLGRAIARQPGRDDRLLIVSLADDAPPRLSQTPLAPLRAIFDAANVPKPNDSPAPTGTTNAVPKGDEQA